MAIIPITKDHIDTVTLELHPKRMFSSSSQTGITGSVYVYANRSPFNRQRIESSPFSAYSVDSESTDSDLLLNEIAYKANSYEKTLDALVSGNPPLYSGPVDRSFAYEKYLSKVNSQKQSPELNKFMEIWRFKPSFSFTSNTLRKNVTKDILFDYYSGRYSNLNWAYTNYNCLTFFTASDIPSNSCLLYPAPMEGSLTNQYVCTSSFSFSFWINPRRTTTVDQAEYRAGTILHSSSSFAVSIVSGSEKDDHGNPEAFRVLLQLSHSADTPPSTVDLSIPNNSRVFPENYIFLSEDNSLKLNSWHQVTISWDQNHNYGTGSMWIDNDLDSEIKMNLTTGSLNDSHLEEFIPLIVGNYYDAPNNNMLVPEMRRFFNAGAASAEGIPDKGASAGNIADPNSLSHKPNADAHEIRIYSKYLTPDERAHNAFSGPSNFNDLVFYLPPFYTKESPYRTILTTPYFTKMTASAEPFNVDLSFGVGGHDLNIENFTRDFANKIYPRHYCLTSSITTVDTLWATANQINWDRGDYRSYFRNRQLFLLPCDNGRFEPNFQLLASGTIVNRPQFRTGTPTDQFIDDKGYLDLSLISLRNLVATSSVEDLKIYSDPNAEESDIAIALTAALPGKELDSDTFDWKDGGDIDPADAYELTVVQRTQDNSSNEVYFFDASNLFYGNKIVPGTFVIEDTALTGSSNAIGIKIKDDGMGNLFRADCRSPQAKWNSVGNILYEEGIAVIKTPNIPLFGQDQFEINFKGEHNVHTYEVNVILSPNLFTSSSNPTFLGGKSDDYSNTTDGHFVAFNSILLHDNNLNVITRSNMARPLIKKIGEKYLIRVKIDY